MYFSRATQSNGHVDGIFPQIRITSPGTSEKVSCQGFDISVEVTCARLRKNSYYYRVFVNGEAVSDKKYKEGNISIEESCLGPLKVSAKLFLCDEVVDEDNITLISIGDVCPNEEGLCGGEGSCIPPSDLSDSDSEDGEHGDCIPPTDVSDSDSEGDSDGDHGDCIPPTDTSDSEEDSDGEHGDCIPPTDASDSEGDSEGEEEHGYCIPPTDVSESDFEGDSDSDGEEEHGDCIPPTDVSDSEGEDDEIPKVNTGGEKGEKGDRGAPGDGGKAKEINSSMCLSSDIRTYIIKPNKNEDIILTLPESKYSGCEEDSFVITIYNDSGSLILIQAAPGNTIKATGGAFLLGLNQSTTFHDSKDVWYPVSK